MYLLWLREWSTHNGMHIQRRNEGGQGTMLRGAESMLGALNDCGGTEKSQKCHKYFLRYRTFASERPQVRTWGWQICSLPQLPSNLVMSLSCALLQSESRSGKCASFTLWQQATIEVTCHDHSSHTLLLRSIVHIVSITRDYTPRSLYYCSFVPRIMDVASSRVVSSWWITHSTQCQRRGCNSTLLICESATFRHWWNSKCIRRTLWSKQNCWYTRPSSWHVRCDSTCFVRLLYTFGRKFWESLTMPKNICSKKVCHWRTVPRR